MSDDPEAHFEVDPRLAADTVFVADWSLCRVLLMDDARFPWLILVPRRAGLIELDDLGEYERAKLMHEIARAMQMLRTLAPAGKLNVGALGNSVRQLHVHVVARREDDVAWPGPVWGHGKPQRHEPAQIHALIRQLRGDTGA